MHACMYVYMCFCIYSPRKRTTRDLRLLLAHVKWRIRPKNYEITFDEFARFGDAFSSSPSSSSVTIDLTTLSSTYSLRLLYQIRDMPNELCGSKLRLDHSLSLFFSLCCIYTRVSFYLHDEYSLLCKGASKVALFISPRRRFPVITTTTTTTTTTTEQSNLVKIYNKKI
jgi:hypothetical protein